MLPMYYRNAVAVVLVYDITNDKSFESVKFWVKGTPFLIEFSYVVTEISKHVMEGSYGKRRNMKLMILK